MKRILSILLMLAAITALAAPKVPIRVGTYEITNSFNRRVQAEKGTMSPQRMWCNSAEAVAEAIIDSDCDIMGIQDVCDSIAGRREAVVPLIDVIKSKGGDYEWLVLSNSNPNFPLEGTMQNGTGVIWKASRFDLRDYGIHWLSGIYDKPGRDKDYQYGSGAVSVMWVKLYDKSSGKELVFASANVNGPTQYDKGQKIVYHEINIANCKNLIQILKSEVVPKGMPSIITLNSHNAPSHDGYKALISDVWQDVHNVLLIGLEDVCEVVFFKDRLSFQRHDAGAFYDRRSEGSCSAVTGWMSVPRRSLPCGRQLKHTDIWRDRTVSGKLFYRCSELNRK